MFNDQQYELTKLCLNAVGGAGFTESVFATQLRFVDNIRFEDVAPYGISLPAFQECQQRLRQWADLIDTWS